MGRKKRKSALIRASFVEPLEKRIFLSGNIYATQGQVFDVGDLDQSPGNSGSVLVPAGASISADQVRMDNVTINGTLSINSSTAGILDATHGSEVTNLAFGPSGRLDLNNNFIIVHATAQNWTQVYGQFYRR